MLLPQPFMSIKFASLQAPDELANTAINTKKCASSPINTWARSESIHSPNSNIHWHGPEFHGVIVLSSQSDLATFQTTIELVQPASSRFSLRPTTGKWVEVETEDRTENLVPGSVPS